MSEADGEYKRTVYHRGVFSPPLYSTYITERSANPRWNEEVSYTQTTCASQPSTLPSKKSNKKLKRHWGNWHTTTEATVLRANPDKTQVTAFHLRNREAKRSLQVSVEWSGPGEHWYPKVLRCNTLDRDVELQDTHTQHQDEGGNSKQPTKEN